MLIFAWFCSFVTHDLAGFSPCSSTRAAAGEACPWPSAGWARCQWQSVAPWPGCGWRNSAGGILLEGVSPTAGSQLTGPKGPMSYSLWCRLPCVGLATPVWDWSRGIPNGTSVSLALNYFTNGAAATSLEILWALLALCRICFWTASSLTGMKLLCT